MIGSGTLATAMLGGGYAASLVLLLRWFAGSHASHILPVEDDRPKQRAPARLRGPSARRSVLTLGIASALLAAEANAFALISTWVPGLSCQQGWLPTAECMLDAASRQPGRGAALAILIGCAGMLIAARRITGCSVFYPTAALMLSIIAFGAVVDLVAGGGGAARPEIVLKLTAGLQLTAAAGFALAAIVLELRTATAWVRCLPAHIAGACVRILGALSMLALWPNLPAASAVALLVVLLLVPGVATALTTAAAIASSGE